MQQRPLPKRSWRYIVAMVVGFTIFTIAVEWCAVLFDSGLLIGVPFFAAIILGFWVLRRRCPICHRRLVARRQPLEDTWENQYRLSGKYRLVYDCEHCQTSWQSDLIGDTRYDDEP